MSTVDDVRVLAAVLFCYEHCGEIVLYCREIVRTVTRRNNLINQKKINAIDRINSLIALIPCVARRVFFIIETVTNCDSSVGTYLTVKLGTIPHNNLKY